MRLRRESATALLASLGVHVALGAAIVRFCTVRSRMWPPAADVLEIALAPAESRPPGTAHQAVSPEPAAAPRQRAPTESARAPWKPAEGPPERTHPAAVPRDDLL